MMPTRRSIRNYALTDHARFEMMRRQIRERDVSEVLASPEQVEQLREGRFVVDVDYEPPVVVTVYRTSKLAKYWRGEQ